MSRPCWCGWTTLPGLPRWLADLLRRQVAQDVITHGKQPGTVPAGLLRWAEEVLSPKVNWRVLLAAELRRAVAELCTTRGNWKWPFYAAVERGEIKRAILSKCNQFCQTAPHGRRLLKAVAGIAIAEHEIFYDCVGAKNGILIKHIIIIMPGP